MCRVNLGIIFCYTWDSWNIKRNLLTVEFWVRWIYVQSFNLGKPQSIYPFYSNLVGFVLSLEMWYMFQPRLSLDISLVENLSSVRINYKYGSLHVGHTIQVFRIIQILGNFLVSDPSKIAQNFHICDAHYWLSSSMICVDSDLHIYLYIFSIRPN